MTRHPGGGEERRRWQARHAADSTARVSAPSAWIVAQSEKLAPDATILDVACGRGRHARALARYGRCVIAVDLIEPAVRSAMDVAVGERSVQGVVADAGALPFADRTIDAIVCVNFLDRTLFPAFARLLRPGGRLIYETFTTAHRALVAAGRAHGPRCPAYLLAPGELAALVAPLAVLAHTEGLVVDEAGERHVARVVAQRRE